MWRDSWWSWRAGTYTQVERWLCFTSLMPRSDSSKHSSLFSLYYYWFGPSLEYWLVTLQARLRPVSLACPWEIERIMRSLILAWVLNESACAQCCHAVHPSNWRRLAMRFGSRLRLIITLLYREEPPSWAVSFIVQKSLGPKSERRPSERQHVLEPLMCLRLGKAWKT